jgi:4-hydroxy-tetrahydrodipicolinate reductase
VAILATASRFDRVAGTVRQLLALGIAVVSSSEEMAWPWYQHAALADRLDAEARAAGRALVGVGVNPGFVMDALAVVLSTVARRVSAVRCVRRVDAALRRLPLQAKVGAGMKVDEFESLARAGKIGHVGLPESAAIIAAGLGRSIGPGTVQTTIAPVVAEKPIASALGLIEPGRVVGMHNLGRWSGDGLAIELDLTMALGLADPKDVIELTGPVSLRLKISGGIPGDSATVATLISYARVIAAAPPGLRTVLDLPVAGCRGRDVG